MEDIFNKYLKTILEQIPPKQRELHSGKIELALRALLAECRAEVLRNDLGDFSEVRLIFSLLRAEFESDGFKIRSEINGMPLSHEAKAVFEAAKLFFGK